MHKATPDCQTRRPRLLNGWVKKQLEWPVSVKD